MTPNQYIIAYGTFNFTINVLPLPLFAVINSDPNSNGNPGLLADASKSLDLDTGLNSGFSYNYTCTPINNLSDSPINLSNSHNSSLLIPSSSLLTSTLYRIILTIIDPLNITR